MSVEEILSSEAVAVVSEILGNSNVRLNESLLNP